MAEGTNKVRLRVNGVRGLLQLISPFQKLCFASAAGLGYRFVDLPLAASAEQLQ
jgi:hypothetical protein